MYCISTQIYPSSNYDSVIDIILISSSGLSFLSVFVFSIEWMTSKPPVARPNTLRESQ